MDEKQVAAAKPDVIILAWAATGDRANPQRAYEVLGWQDLPAIRNHRVYVIKDELLNTPGPPLIEAVKELCKLLRAKDEKDNAETPKAQRLAER